MSEEQQVMSDEIPSEVPSTETEDESQVLDQELDRIYEEASQEETPEQPQTQPQPQAGQPQALAAPNTWDKGNQELFRTLPPETQKQIIKREQEREAVVRESFQARNYAAKMQPFGQVIQELEPYFRTFSKPDGTPLWGDDRAMAAEIKTVLGLKMLLAKDPAAALHVMQDWAEQNAGYRPPSEGDPTPSGQELSLRARLTQLEQQEALRAQQAQQQRLFAEGQQALNNLANHVTNLGNQKDASGQPLFPHLHGEFGERVGLIMGNWMRANMPPEGITPELYRQAYETAVFTLPETRELEFKAREEARIRQYKTKSEAARKAQGINPGTKRAPDSVPETSLEQDMDAIWAKYNT